MRFRAAVLGPRSLSWLGFVLSQQDKTDSLQTYSAPFSLSLCDR